MEADEEVPIRMEQDSLIASAVCKGVRYGVVKEIFHAQAFIGHGTRVWLVSRPSGKLCIMKESWIPPNQPCEADFL